MGSDEAVFVAWTRIGRFLVGTVYTSSPPNGERFTGEIDGALVTLEPRLGNSWHGTLVGGSLTMSTVEGNGAVRTFAFRRAQGAEYDVAERSVRAGSHLRPDAARVSADLEELRNDLEAARLTGLSTPNLLAAEQRDARARVVGRTCAFVALLDGDTRAIRAAGHAFGQTAVTAQTEARHLRIALARHGAAPRLTSAARSTLAEVQATLTNLRGLVAAEITAAERLDTRVGRPRSACDASQAQRSSQVAQTPDGSPGLDPFGSEG